MAERQNYDLGLIKVGELLESKRKALGEPYKTRENFISNRENELFGGESWLSVRHLSNLERGKNWISIEKLIVLSAALEEDPRDLFDEIISTYQKYNSRNNK